MAGEVGVLAEDDRAFVGSRLAGDGRPSSWSCRRRWGPITARISTFFEIEGKRVQGLEAVEADGDVVEIEQGIGMGTNSFQAGSGAGGGGGGRGAPPVEGTRECRAAGTGSPGMNIAPRANSHNSGRAEVKNVLPALTSTAAEDGADQRCRVPPTATPDDGLDGIRGCELARVDDADLGHVERAADPGP